MSLESVIKQKHVHEVVTHVLVGVSKGDSVLGSGWIWIGFWIGDWLRFSFELAFDTLVGSVVFVEKWVVHEFSGHVFDWFRVWPVFVALAVVDVLGVETASGVGKKLRKKM